MDEGKIIGRGRENKVRKTGNGLASGYVEMEVESGFMKCAEPSRSKSRR